MDYEYVYKLPFLTDYNISNVQSIIETIIYSVLAFALPFLLGHPQILVGTLVNAFLIIGALNLKSYKLVPVILAPSLGVLAKGAIFGPLTSFLLILAPFIWIGNTILVFSFKYFKLHKKINFFVTLFAGSVLKALFLFIVTFALVSFSVMPSALLIPMGILQLSTAVMGGFVAFGAQEVKKKFF